MSGVRRARISSTVSTRPQLIGFARVRAACAIAATLSPVVAAMLLGRPDRVSATFRLAELVFRLKADGERQIVRGDRRDHDEVCTESPNPGNRGRGQHWAGLMIRPHTNSAIVIAGDDPAHRA
jgi:hypothetical protein